LALADDIRPDYANNSFDIYDLKDQLLMVAHDRFYYDGQLVFDLIPNKGKAITQLSIFWYELFEGILDSNYISADIHDLPDDFLVYADELEGRFMLLSKVDEFPLNVKVHGYLTEGLIDEYLAKGTVGGVDAEPGLTLNNLLDQCIYIPYLLDGDLGDKIYAIDHNAGSQIDLMKTIELYGNKDAMVLCSNALELYEIIHGLAKSRGALFVDISLRFGTSDNQIVITSVPTPDNSLLWEVAESPDGQEQDTPNKLFVLQPLLDWMSMNPGVLLSQDRLPDELPDEISRRYVLLTESVTGEDLV